MTDVADKKLVQAHAWTKEEHEWYVETRWVSRRLFEEEAFTGRIIDPCAGSGRIVSSAREAGFEADGCDIVDRGFALHSVEDFLGSTTTSENFVFNPPFDLCEEFARHAVSLASRKVAMIMPTRRLNAAGKWINQLPLFRVWYLTPRPSMPPGAMAMDYEARGVTPSGGKQDFCWVVFLNGYDGRASVQWLNRDKSQPAA